MAQSILAQAILAQAIFAQAMLYWITVLGEVVMRLREDSPPGNYVAFVLNGSVWHGSRLVRSSCPLSLPIIWLELKLIEPTWLELKWLRNSSCPLSLRIISAHYLNCFPPLVPDLPPIPSTPLRKSRSAHTQP